MDPESKSSKARRPTDVTDAPALWQSAFKYSDDWIKPTFRALEDVQAASQQWMTHRLEDFKKAVDASRQMSECKDFAEAATIQQKWIADCTRRIVADWTALIGPVTMQRPQPGEGTKKSAE
jgi:hypothetical protein